MTKIISFAVVATLGFLSLTSVASAAHHKKASHKKQAQHKSRVIQKESGQRMAIEKSRIIS
jgi:hypothetical protein